MNKIKTSEDELIKLNEIVKKIPDEKKEKAGNFIEGFVAAVDFLSNQDKNPNESG